jgi:peroxiredoxin
MRIAPIFMSGLAALALAACSYVAEEEAKSAVDPTPEAAVSASYEGPEAPDFSLTGTDGGDHSLASYMADGKTVVLEWFNPECPVVRKYHDPGTMKGTCDAVAGDDVVWLAVNSGGPGKQGHGADKNKAAADKWDLPYPVLFDEDGSVGRAYGATNTPHMFIVRDGRIVYQGAIDGSKAGAADTNYVTAALASIRAGEPIADAETKAFGCSVKYAN